MVFLNTKFPSCFLPCLNPRVTVRKKMLTDDSFIPSIFTTLCNLRAAQRRWPPSMLPKLFLSSTLLYRQFCICSEQDNYLFTTLPFCHTFWCCLQEANSMLQRSRGAHTQVVPPPIPCGIRLQKMSMWIYIRAFKLILFWLSDFSLWILTSSMPHLII